MQIHWKVTAGALALLLGYQTASAQNRLLDGFKTPPDTAKPQLWWHWMNGNIDADEAARDLEWMHAVGIGGVQIFEAGLGARQRVKRPLAYMSEGWRQAFRTSAQKAKALGMDFAITTSPGWSSTGGPWVLPQDAMKKLVWSETVVAGAKPFTGVIAKPPSVAGPYQDVSVSAIEHGAHEGPAFYRDIALLAYPVAAASSDPSASINGSGGKINGLLLNDGAFGPTQTVEGDADGVGWVRYSFQKPRTIRSAIVGLPGARGFGAPNPPAAAIQASEDGLNFRTIAELPATRSPSRSVTFAPATARFFRLRLSASTEPGFVDTLDFAPGAIRPPFPKPSGNYAVSEFQLREDARVSAVEEKAGFAAAADYYALSTPSDAPAVPTKDVIDLSGKMRPDGTLDWTPPAGTWRVVRMGMSLTGHHNGPAPDSATGLEVDKLSAPRVSAYLDHYLASYRDTLGQDIGALNGLISDSIESGPQNWTNSFAQDFARMRGYSITPWLPVLTGAIIGSAVQSDAFLWDFRKTIAQLLTSAHYGTIAAKARSMGLRYYAEALEDHRPQLGDDLAIRAQADIPMGALWTYKFGTAPKPTYVADIRGAASVANLYGKPLVAAESMTTFGSPWGFGPADLKPTADMEMALGVNRIILHSSVHQALGATATPALSLMPMLGHYFNRNEPWADMAQGWISYLSRSQFLLQQGHAHADYAYFIGEEAPVTGLYGDAAPKGTPAGLTYDFVDAAALDTQLSPKDGRLATASGTSYRFLFLGGSSRRMTLATLRRIEKLARAGAIIAGRKPEGSPSLSDDGAVFRTLADTIWTLPTILDVETAGEAVQRLDMSPAWSFSGESDSVAVARRDLPKGAIIFVVNKLPRPVTGQLSLAMNSFSPEAWDAMDGTRKPLSYRTRGDRTDIPLTLGPNAATFILLREPTKTTSRTIPMPQERQMSVDLNSGWTVQFQPDRGAPPALRMDRLAPLNERGEPGVRYFSGVSTYARTFQLGQRDVKRREKLMLDLGKVGDVARVTVNGKSAGIAWHAPYRIDIGPFVHAGDNSIQVEVANLWVNRLIGDAQPGAQRITTVEDPTYHADAPLRSSGLIGPVSLSVRQ